jgi:hypothetical protein
MHDASIGGSMNLLLCHRRSAQEVSTAHLPKIGSSGTPGAASFCARPVPFSAFFVPRKNESSKQSPKDEKREHSHFLSLTG